MLKKIEFQEQNRLYKYMIKYLSGFPLSETEKRGYYLSKASFFSVREGSCYTEKEKERFFRKAISASKAAGLEFQSKSA